MTSSSRIERDTLGEIALPADALYGPQTQRAIDNFPLSGLTLPASLIRALAEIKAACAAVNGELGLLEEPRAEAIVAAARAVAAGEYRDQFPVDLFQTGSGTSSNMNMNEVLARLAADRCELEVHPNDHVNLGQSSNDVFPSAIRVAAAEELERRLLPAIEQLVAVIDRRSAELAGQIKSGRTHLMDALPMTFGDELAVWSAQLREAEARIQDGVLRLQQLPLGGTAIGSGVNAHPQLAPLAVVALLDITGIAFTSLEQKGVAIAAQDTLVEISGQLRVLAVSVMKICNDLRWMNSGPLAGLGEITLPALQPGSSIMPGKVNPVIPEAVAQLCAQVMGNDVAITVGGQSGNFQLNVMLPLMAYNLLQSIELLSNGVRLLADRAIADFSVNDEQLEEAIERNPILVTALNPIIGYERAAAIAKRAYQEGRAIIDVAREESGLGEEELAALLDPARLASGQG